MAEFKITRFRYTWQGEWDSGVASYNKDDVVYYNGSAWVCVRQHDPSATFNADQAFVPVGETLASPAWVKMQEGNTFTGDWTAATQYDPGAITSAGGSLYICLSSHQSSSTFNLDSQRWELFAIGSNFRNEWEAETVYRVGDIIRYGSFTYQCILEHESGLTSDGVKVGNNDTVDDSTAETWKKVTENYTYVGEYQSNTLYKLNDLVKYGGSILKCTTDHTSSATTGSILSANFETYLPGFSYSNEWNGTDYYAIGDVVKQGGILYVANENNRNSQPGKTDTYPEGNLIWTAIIEGNNFLGVHELGTLYKEGDVVLRGGSLWRSITDQVINNDSSLAIFDDSNWELVVGGQNFRASWSINTDYNFYDVVYFRGVVYYCNTPHLSSFENYPGDNGNGVEYWNIIVISDEHAGMKNIGDLVTYNLYKEVLEDGTVTLNFGDGSTYGSTAIPIGQEDQLLVVENNTGDIGYKTWGTLTRVFFVRSNGIDDITDTNRGHNYFKPWKTIRYALEQADDGYAGSTTIFVSTGLYEEVLPLIVPVRTAVVGEELRSVIVRANSAIPALENDASYTLATLTRIGLLLPNLFQGIEVDKSPGNEVEQHTTNTVDSGTANTLANLWSDIINTIDNLVNDVGSYPTITGSNTESEDPGRLTVITSLENNREFLKAEAIAYMSQEYSEYSFDTVKCERDIDKFIDAFKYDLLHTGNYKSVLAGRYYANAVTGSALEDMWYVRDSTGLRNMTFEGLEGSLPALQEGEVYRIPTGGAYVSLDPGWGPDDERVWITNRSCYVQNCTTFGTAAIGQKIDGLLHNGGNKSIVSNDFTQIISDGIGAWVSNGGRVELVSVFTYYSHIGMFAKDGGIIRSTNGNNSYGDFGSLADGLDPDEVVRYGYLNTQTEQAVVSSAFAGEILDYILGLEFANMGQNYSYATYSISSSGTGAVSVQEEFRDNAMFECQVLSDGAGFTQYGNQAQLGNEYLIVLAAAESATEAEILGMRIIIISGEGTGQYGYVYSYNAGTKNCVVYRESDGQPGWDHILPGTPSKSLLTTGTRYRIEPRPTFSAPPYSAAEVSLNETYSLSAGTYGQTSTTYTGLTGSFGTGTVDDALIPIAAVFTVAKTNRAYTVTLTTSGAGYRVGDTITIAGTDLGGLNDRNDLIIEVLTVSDDSTNSILTFTSSGAAYPDQGRFVLTPSNSDIGLLSANGTSWEEFTLPSSGNWIGLTYGNGKFVSVQQDSGVGAYSTDAETWTSTAMPASRNWRAVTYGKPVSVSTGIFVAVSGTLNAGAYSTNGTTWTSTTMPTVGDSTICEWTDIAFGAGKFVALANEQNVVAIGTWNGTTLTWTSAVMDVIEDSSRKQWVSISYGNRRFVAISNTGDVAYSFDATIWYPASMPKQDGSTLHNWKQIRYGQGVFFAVGDTGGKLVAADVTTGPTTFSATSYDGIVWESRELATSQEWAVAVFGNPDITFDDSTFVNYKPTWVLASGNASNKLNNVYTGAKALGRAVVSSQGISNMKLWESGSGYLSSPTLTLTCPGKTIDPDIRTRLADAVLAQPTFLSRGTSYKTSTTYVTVSGDGFADKTPDGKFITVDGLTKMPGPGAQFYIGGRSDYFVAVSVGIDEVTLPDGTIRSTFQISPQPTLDDNLLHGMEIVIRERYSQVRITGHDFLDIGTGNFENTNYPNLYDDYNYTIVPFQEVYNLNGGRVFYTSTDQSGNFRAGKLFAVEQATGIITISADFFDLAGLTELRLAGVRVGSTAVVREFSRDPLFLQNSNNVIPTQRAIRSYLQSRLNIGGEDLLTPSIIAGTVKVGPAEINSTAGLTIDIPVVADFSGSGSGISGSIIAQTMFSRSFRPA